MDELRLILYTLKLMYFVIKEGLVFYGIHISV